MQNYIPTYSNSTYAFFTPSHLPRKLERVPADKAYFISKELLMTERTYKKDLELINVWFRDEVSKEENMPTHALTVLFGVVDPLYEFHCSFLRELEHRLATWEGRTGMPLQTHVQGVGDILLKKVQMTEVIFHAIFPSFDFIPV
ncbi:UNVERIFIED_CONTAM: FERM, RhoGEF and pleckstrin domain-containing protein 2 [Trichonephila clavipes]